MTLVFVLCKKYQILLKNVGEDLSINVVKGKHEKFVIQPNNNKYSESANLRQGCSLSGQHLILR